MLRYTGLDNMKYMGSKNRHAKELLPIILKNRVEGQCYVEPFVGGANMIDKVDGWRIGADVNECLIALWIGLQNGRELPLFDRDEYQYIKRNKSEFDNFIVGWAGIGHSYNGVWFSGYAGEIETKIKTRRDYRKEAVRNVRAQIKRLEGVEFRCCCYKDLLVPSQSIIYCDPPYQSTAKYRDSIDHDDFWQWCREKIRQGHDVFVSEYQAPDDFICIWEKQVNSSLTKDTGAKKSVERLFQHRSQLAT